MTVFESLLNNAGTVYRRTRTSDGQGGWEIDYVLYATIQGRIRPAGAGNTERDVAMLENRRVTHVLYVVAGTDIQRGDRVYIGDLVVDVEAIREPSLANEHLEIDCIEYQVEAATVVSGS
jgi:head-tail adaptor